MKHPMLEDVNMCCRYEVWTDASEDWLGAHPYPLRGGALQGYPNEYKIRT